MCILKNQVSTREIFGVPSRRIACLIYSRNVWRTNYVRAYNQNIFHLAVRLSSDNARMTSKRVIETNYLTSSVH